MAPAVGRQRRAYFQRFRRTRPFSAAAYTRRLRHMAPLRAHVTPIEALSRSFTWPPHFAASIYVMTKFHATLACEPPSAFAFNSISSAAIDEATAARQRWRFTIYASATKLCWKVLHRGSHALLDTTEYSRQHNRQQNTPCRRQMMKPKQASFTLISCVGPVKYTLLNVFARYNACHRPPTLFYLSTPREMPAISYANMSSVPRVYLMSAPLPDSYGCGACGIGLDLSAQPSRFSEGFPAFCRRTAWAPPD